MKRFVPAIVLAVVSAFVVMISGCSGGGGSPFGAGAWIPAITSLSPTIVPVGSPNTTVTITGSQILDQAQVFLDNTQVAANQVDPNTIQAFVPANLLTTEREVDVTVKNPNGNVSNALKFGIGTTSSVPTITSLAPNNAAAGSGPVVVTVNGTNFIDGRSTVRWNGTNKTTLFVSATQLQFTATQADLAAAGTAQVTVVNSPPGGGTSTPATFTVN